MLSSVTSLHLRISKTIAFPFSSLGSAAQIQLGDMGKIYQLPRYEDSCFPVPQRSYDPVILYQ